MDLSKVFKANYKLPKPLPKEQFQEFLRRAQEGDKTSEEELIIHNLRLIVHIIKNKFSMVEIEQEELLSLGTFGLLKAIRTFDIYREIPFGSYASQCITNEILMTLRKTKKHKKDVSFDETIAESKDNQELKLENILPSDTDILGDYIEGEMRVVLRELVERLPERKRIILEMRFGFNQSKIYTQHEIAEVLGISRSYVSRIEEKALKDLRSILHMKYDYPNFKRRTSPGMERKPKKSTIYKLLLPSSRTDIDRMLTFLKPEERELITLRYGTDLDNPEISPLWNKQIHGNAWWSLVKKMRRLLDEFSYESIYNVSQEQEKETVIIALSQIISYDELLKDLNYKNLLIITLAFAYIKGKIYSPSDIAKFLNISEEEVKKTIKTVLELYSRKISEYLKHNEIPTLILNKH